MTIKSIFAAMAVAITTPTILAESKTELLPEVKEILEVKFNEANIAKNGYIAAIAIDAPEGVDYLKIGKEIVLTNNTKIRQAVVKQDSQIVADLPNVRQYFQKEQLLSLDLNINGEEYNFPCSKLYNTNCIEQLLKNKMELATLLSANKLLLTRYEQIIILTDYNQIVPVINGSMVVDNILLGNLSQLRLSKAVMMISQGDIDKGLEIIQQEINFNKKMLITETTSLTQELVTKQLLITYHMISGLLDLPVLADQLDNPKLLALLEPLTTEIQQTPATNLIVERNRYLRELAIFSKDELINELKMRIRRMFRTVDIDFSYDKNATLNALYQEYEPYIKRAEVTSLPEASNIYLEDLENQAIPKNMTTIKEIYSKYGKNNILGGIYIDAKMVFFNQDYREDLYNLINYLALVNTKLQIKQMGISKQQVPEFLNKLGDKAKNSYSQQPYKWDAHNQILSSDWLGFRMTRRDGERANVYIPFD